MSLDDIQVRNRQKFKLGIFDCSSRKKTFWVPRHDESLANSFSAGCSTLFLFRASRGVTNRWRTRKGRNQRLGCASVRLTARECRSAHSPKARFLQFHLIVLLRLSFMQIAWQLPLNLNWFDLNLLTSSHRQPLQWLRLPLRLQRTQSQTIGSVTEATVFLEYHQISAICGLELCTIVSQDDVRSLQVQIDSADLTEGTECAEGSERVALIDETTKKKNLWSIFRCVSVCICVCKRPSCPWSSVHPAGRECKPQESGNMSDIRALYRGLQHYDLKLIQFNEFSWI